MAAKKINILIPTTSRPEFLVGCVISKKRNKHDLPMIKIGTGYSLLEVKNLTENLNNYLDKRDYLKDFPKFSQDDKFNFIVLPAHSVGDYGIDNLPTEEEIMEISENNCKYIIEPCCAECNNSIRDRYPHLDLEYIRGDMVPIYISLSIEENN